MLLTDGFTAKSHLTTAQYCQLHRLPICRQNFQHLLLLFWSTNVQKCWTVSLVLESTAQNILYIQVSAGEFTVHLDFFCQQYTCMDLSFWTSSYINCNDVHLFCMNLMNCKFLQYWNSLVLTYQAVFQQCSFFLSSPKHQLDGQL